MTRHGKADPSAAGASPPAEDPRAPMMPVVVYRLTTSRVPGRQYTAEVQQSGMSASTTALPAVGRAIADIDRKSKSP